MLTPPTRAHVRRLNDRIEQLERTLAAREKLDREAAEVLETLNGNLQGQDQAEVTDALSDAIARCMVVRLRSPAPVGPTVREGIVRWLRSFALLRGATLGAEEDAANEALLTVVADALERGDDLEDGR